jgi:hypothetical protein
MATIACGTEPEIDLFPVDGIVLGAGRGPTGTPVANAWVALEGLYPLGNGNTEPVGDSTRTDSAGHYLATVGVGNLPDTVVALTIRVWPPPESGLAPSWWTLIWGRETRGIHLS